MNRYGKELVIDLVECDTSLFTRPSIDDFFTILCEVIKMQKCAVHFWDDIGVAENEKQTNPKTKGTSAVCFILTSTIVIHTLDLTGEIFINIFSCKDFDSSLALKISEDFFKGKALSFSAMYRGKSRK